MDIENTIIPKGYAVLYSNKDGNTEKYYYRLSNGDGNEIPSSVIVYFGYKANDLPVHIEESKLLTVLNKTFVSYGELISLLATKIDANRVIEIANTKVSKNQFNSFISKVAYADELQLGLNKKADAENTAQELALKANSADVFTIKETFETLMYVIGAGSCATIRERDAMDHGAYPFVWVLDASDDLDPTVKSPAFYRWNKNHWDYLGTLGEMIPSGGGEEVDLTEVYQQINALSQAISLLQNVVSGMEENFISHIQNQNIHVPKATIDSLLNRVTAIEQEVGFSSQLADDILGIVGGE